MNKTGIIVIVIMLFFLCVSTNSKDIYAEDMIRYQVIGGNTLVISGTGEVNSVLGFDENIGLHLLIHLSKSEMVLFSAMNI